MGWLDKQLFTLPLELGRELWLSIRDSLFKKVSLVWDRRKKEAEDLFFVCVPVTCLEVTFKAT